MPILIKYITAGFLDNYTTNLSFYVNLSSDIQFEDYINLNGFIAYLQNFTKVQSVIPLNKPLNFGLKNEYNIPTRFLQISY